jgi:hypothetical protein
VRLTASLALIFLFPAAVAARPVVAQSAHHSSNSAAASPTAQSGSIAGTVVAAGTEQPIPGAVVVLEAARDAAMVTTGRPLLGRSITTFTNEQGGYRFEGVAPGSYRLMVRHVGFHPAVLEVELARGTPFRVSVGLLVNTIRLEAVNVQTLPDPYGRNRTLAEETRRGRLDAERYGEERFVYGDATVMTHSDVMEAVTLAETDLFRALHRLPGVTTRDDWTAGLWTRGASWSHTRVYLDGLPLFNPVHAMGVLAGVNPDAIGAATFHPGGRSAAVGEGAAGVLDLTTRRAAEPGLHGLGELSVVSARATSEWAGSDGRAGLLVAARRSHVDLATRLAEKLGSRGSYLPYVFHDLSARFDTELGRRWALEASGLWSEDRVTGSLPYLLRDTRGDWGNLLGRVSALVPLRRGWARLTIGASRFDGRLVPTLPSVTTDTSPVHAPTHNRLSVALVGVDILPSAAGRPSTWVGGVQLTVHRLSFEGPYPRPYPVVVLPETLRMSERRTTAAVWAERRWLVSPFTSLETGLRVEFGPRGYLVPQPAFAPRLAARYTPNGGRVTLSAALSRSYQYAQALAPAGPSVGPDLYVTDVWLLSSDSVPAVRADVATAGAEVWLGGGWVGAAHAYGRRSTGVTVPEPSPGRLTGERPLQVAATNLAAGADLSLRRIVGRWTVSAAYTLASSELRAVSRLDRWRYRYPAPADRRHAADLTVMGRLASGLRLGAAATVASGAPFSRFLLGVAPCDSTQGSCQPADTAALTIELPNAERTKTYGSIDVLADWTREWRRWRIGAFVQVRNVLGNANAVTYTGSVEQCRRDRPPEQRLARPGVCDRFERGIGRLPLVGVRVSF